jgi:four helix bundle protein
MASNISFEDIDAWKKARELCNITYNMISTTALEKDFALRDQINRSSCSVMHNIAEGYDRGGKKEFIQFLFISKASAGELRSQLYRVHDRKYISEDRFNNLNKEVMEISKMISKFINYLISTEFKGDKYR